MARISLLAGVSLLAAAASLPAFAQPAAAARPAAAPAPIAGQGGGQIVLPGQAVTGTIGAEDPKLALDNSSYEIYRVRVAAGQRLVVNLSSNAFVPVVAVGPSVSGDCEECTGASAERGGTASVTRRAESDGFLEIRVNTMEAGESGAFRLTTEIVAPGRMQVGDIALNQTLQGRLEARDGTNDDNAFVKAYRIRLAAGQAIQADMSSTEFDPKLSIWAPGTPPRRRGAAAGPMTQVAEDDDSGPGVNARIRFTAPTAGVYHIRAAALGEGAMGAFTLRVGPPVTPPPLPAPRPLAMGQTGSGTLAENGPRLEEDGEERLVQRFAFAAAANTTYRLSAASSAFDTLLAVGRLNPDGSFEELASDDDGAGGGTTNSRLRWRAPAAGRYVIQISAVGDGTGAFTTSVEPAAPSARPGVPRPLAIGSSVQGALADGGPRQGDADALYGLYSVDLTAGQRVTVRVERDGDSPIDPMVQIGRGTPEAFTQDAMDDDGGQNLNARLRFVAPATGTYLVRATVTAANAEGGYIVSVAPTPPAVTPPDPTAIALGTPVQGTLAETDPSFNQENYYDRYVFDGKEGETFEISLNSEAFDAMVAARPLNRVDDDYKVDDDGGGGTNSKLVYTVEHAGPQVIRVSALQAEATGAYTLTVRKTN